MAPKKSGKRKTADRAADSVVAELDDRAAKRSDGEGAVATAVDRASEPVVGVAEGQAVQRYDWDVSVATKAVHRPPAESLPDVDVVLLAEIEILGHYPRNLNGRSLETATETRRNERNLYKRLQSRKSKMEPQCIAFIDAVRELGSFRNAILASSSTGQAPQAQTNAYCHT